MMLVSFLRAVGAAVTRLLRPSPLRPQREILCDAAGFDVRENGTRLFQMNWSRVKEIFAYKIDLFSYDEICLGLRDADDSSYRWVSEADSGYQKLLEELEHRFPGIRTDWFTEVAFPAFAANRTTLWEASGDSTRPIVASSHGNAPEIREPDQQC